MRVLFVNPRSGSADSLGAVRRAAEQRGVTVRDVERLDADGAEVLGVAGGDGTVARVAGLAVERDLPLVVVPLGTRNHFARDLGLDCDDPVAALDAFEAPERRVDVGRVNGRVFVNNVSVGVYAAAVHDPGYGKRRDVALRAMARAAMRLRRAPVRLVFDGEARAVLVLLVGNNEYRLRSLADLADVGGRRELDTGTLHVYTIERGRLRLRFEERDGPRFRVECRARRVKAAIDGEPVVLECPLGFEIAPRALRVRIAA